MFSTESFFADIEKVIAQVTEADRPRLRKMAEELDLIAAKVPRTADRCYAYQARLYAKLEEFELALAAVERALQLMPMDDNLVILRGDIHRKAHEYSQALQDYSQVVDAHPEAVTARMRRAEMLQARGEYEDALKDVTEALKHEPRSLRLLYRRAMILVDMRRAAEAMADLRTVARLSQDEELRRKAEKRLRELGER
jgi:tetratricopeptide (TPR) repeat protein